MARASTDIPQTCTLKCLRTYTSNLQMMQLYEYIYYVYNIHLWRDGKRIMNEYEYMNGRTCVRTNGRNKQMEIARM